MLVEKNLNNIEYVIVEVVNRITREIIIGCFRGLTYINEDVTYAYKVEDAYIILENNGSIFMLKLEDVTISTISIGIKTNSWTVSKYSYNLKKDMSIKFLQEIQEYYIDHGKASRDGLIDTSDFKIDKSSYLAVAMKRYNVLNLNRITKETNNVVESGNDTTKDKIIINNTKSNKVNENVIKTSILKRTTTYNQNETIKKMNIKVEMLKNNKYTVVLPIEKTTHNEDENKTQWASNTIHNDENFRAEYFYC